MKRKPFTINEADREDFVSNDESWYLLWKHSGMALRAFVRSYRRELNQHIANINHRTLDGRHAMH
jgi:hypothetical protein